MHDRPFASLDSFFEQVKDLFGCVNNSTLMFYKAYAVKCNLINGVTYGNKEKNIKLQDVQ